MDYINYCNQILANKYSQKFKQFKIETNRKMKKKIILVGIVFLFSSTLWGQEYKLKVSGNKTLNLQELNHVVVEGYDGAEVVFSTESESEADPERAEGLTAINAMGLKDNSGIGLSVTESGESIDVIPLSRRSDRRYIIKVPQNVKIKYEHSTPYGSQLKVKNVSAEIEASTKHNAIFLENVTGPVTINTVHGNVDAIFTTVNQASPTSIISAHGLIDVALPSNTKANLSMDSNWGELFTDMTIEMEQSEDGLKSYSSNVKGTINGGGVSIKLSSAHGNIYLRKKG